MMSAPGTGTGVRVARCKVTCYLRFGVPDAGSVSEARYKRHRWKRLWWAGVAQLVEHLICNQRVGGSNPFASSKFRLIAHGGCAVGQDPEVRLSFREKRPPKGSTGQAESAALPRRVRFGSRLVSPKISRMR